MALSIILSNASDKPIYAQIEEQIKTAVLSGQVAANEQLPSIRALARDLRVSVITTTRAYSDLAEEGFITNVAGKGAFVMPRDSALVSEYLVSEVESSLSEAVYKAQLAGLSNEKLHELLDVMIQVEKSENE